jgi:ABC-type antimicrobial peptide transport system permease subunit
MTLVIRVGQDPGQMAGQIRQAIRDVDAGIPIPDLRSMEETLGMALAGPRLNLFLFSLFASAALLLAAVSLYGLTAFSVASRVREVGVRLALGAPRLGVLRWVLGHGMGLTLLGTGIGLVGAFLLTRFLEALLFDVDPMDVRAYGVVALVLGLSTCLATVVPAIRAVKVDPASILQAD